MASIKTSISAQQVTKGVITYLTKANRLTLLSQIGEAALKASRKRLDPSLAIIESVLPLSNLQLNNLKESLERVFKRNLTIKNEVNDRLIAGLRIKVGDQVIDQSLSSRINQLTQEINL
jgi:F-type H+-transporting ATPase subunit delta